MSKISITPSATGTGVFTISSPATNTDRTLTLPDEAGTVLTSASSLASDNLTGAVTVSGGNVGIGTSSPNSKLTSQTASTSTSAFSFAGQLNNSYGSNDSITALGFHNRSDVNATGVGAAIALSGGGTSGGSGNLIFCIKPTTDIASVVAPSHEKMRIDSSGNTMVGLTAASARFTVGGAAATAANSTLCRIGDDAYGSDVVLSVAPGVVNFDAPGVVGGRVKIDSSGNLLQGYTTGGFAGGACIKATGYNIKQGFSGALGASVFNIDWSGGTAKLWIDTTNVGTITLTSDYRIKQDVETQTEAGLSRIMALRPVTYQHTDFGTLFKADGITREGFIAHELQEVIPSAVEGEKDAENQIQSLKIDALCAVMVKAIQEQQAIITALETRLSALEG